MKKFLTLILISAIIIIIFCVWVLQQADVIGKKRAAKKAAKKAEMEAASADA